MKLAMPRHYTPQVPTSALRKLLQGLIMAPPSVMSNHDDGHDMIHNQ